MSETREELPIQFYANPRWLWILSIVVMALHLPFLFHTRLKHRTNIASLSLFICLLVGTTVPMVQVPYMNNAWQEASIQYSIGQSDLGFENIAIS